MSLFFKNSNPNACGFTECTLLNAGCLAPYSGNKLAIAASYPYPLKAQLDIKEGYQEKFCIKCVNGEFDSIGKDNLIFSQSGQCMNSLTPSAQVTFQAPVLDYNATENKYLLAEHWWRYFFDARFFDRATGKMPCPIKKCGVEMQDPANPDKWVPLPADSPLTVGPAPAYALYQDLTVAKGYSHKVRYYCDNGF